jgi:hypothetical protein
MNDNATIEAILAKNTKKAYKRPSRSKAAIAARAASLAARETATAPVYAPFTDEQKAQFQSRIKNEKANIWRIGKADPQLVLDYCLANEQDTVKNAAVRFARRDAMAYARRVLTPVAPF